MVAEKRKSPDSPFSLVVTGEAEEWQRALQVIVGPQWIQTHRVRTDQELCDVVASGLADAAVLDEDAPLGADDVLKTLRMIRRLNQLLPVVIVTRRRDQHWLQSALSLTAFSVVAKPLELEELLRNIRRMMVRLDKMLREGPNG
jgi:DNA-binding NtrC family response regulator